MNRVMSQMEQDYWCLSVHNWGPLRLSERQKRLLTRHHLLGRPNRQSFQKDRWFVRFPPVERPCVAWLAEVRDRLRPPQARVVWLVDEVKSEFLYKRKGDSVRLNGATKKRAKSGVAQVQCMLARLLMNNKVSPILEWAFVT